jgi:hypothetical protein
MSICAGGRLCFPGILKQPTVLVTAANKTAILAIWYFIVFPPKF